MRPSSILRERVTRPRANPILTERLSAEVSVQIRFVEDEIKRMAVRGVCKREVRPEPISEISPREPSISPCPNIVSNVETEAAVLSVNLAGKYVA